LVSVGSLVFQDIRWTVRRYATLNARITMFQTDDFQSRVFQLESDVAGSMTIPALHGTGVRTYVSLTASPIRSLSVQSRIGATFLQDIVRQRSGPDEIHGHRAADAVIQVRWSVGG
jgi:hypothetical protein